MKKIINEIIIKEKCDFISKNSTFFVNNFNNKIVMLNLKSILMDIKPLTECDTYQDIMEEIKKQNIDNVSDEALNILFKLVYLIRSEAKTDEIKQQETEIIRQYTKYVDNEIPYINQSNVTIGIPAVSQILSNDEQEKKGRI